MASSSYTPLNPTLPLTLNTIITSRSQHVHGWWHVAVHFGRHEVQIYSMSSTHVSLYLNYDHWKNIRVTIGGPTQTYEELELSRINPLSRELRALLKNMSTICSTMRPLLTAAWMIACYESYRTVLWKTCTQQTHPLIPRELPTFWNGSPLPAVRQLYGDSAHGIDHTTNVLRCHVWDCNI